MTTPGTVTLCKAERIDKKRLISRLFEGEGKSFAMFPLRVVYIFTEKDEAQLPVSILVSVSKRHFKRAVKRNRVKRQIREAYRKHKLLLHQALADKPHHMAVAFIWLDKELHSSDEIDFKMKRALQRLTEKITPLS